jgi:hypothetical protein
LLLPVLQRDLGEGQGKRSVVTASGNQPHAIANALKAQAVAVILDLMKPIGSGRDAGGFDWKAEIKGLNISQRIGGLLINCELIAAD